MAVFNAGWWSVELPAGWQAEPTRSGASFSRSAEGGELRISTARKNEDQISEGDLKEFTAERVTAGHTLEPVQVTAFSGFHCQWSDGECRWKEWWLRYGGLLIYATYLVPQERIDRGEEEEAIRILGSLAVHSDAG